MLGILRKDLYMLFGAYKKNLALVFALYAALVLGIKQTFFLSWLIWMTSFYSLSTFTMDDSCGWDRYARTLPVSCGKIVGARFLAALVMLGIGVAFSALVGTALCFFWDGLVYEMVVTDAVIAALALAMLGIIFPAAYKWGVEKARNGFLVIFLLVFLAPALLRKSELVQGWLRAAKDWMEGTALEILCAEVLAIGLVIFALGGWVSCRIYRGKEF